MGHIHELYDFTTSAFIVHKNRVLLLHHIKINKWLQPGGHIELDEEPIEALYREVEEETGLTRKDLEIVELAKDKRANGHGSNVLPLPLDINVHAFDGEHQHIDLCYLMRSSSEIITLEIEKAHDIGWFTFQQIKELHKNGSIFGDTLELAELALRNA